MNKKLTEEIARHILSNLGVLPSSFVDSEQTKLVIDKQFLLSEKIKFQDSDGKEIINNIYGCQISIANSKDFKLLLADCTQDKDFPEYCLLVQLKDSPAFGVYLISEESYTPSNNEYIDVEALIAVNSDGKFWMPCTTYLQGTFLAGMEQLKDLGFGWIKCSSYKEQYDQLMSLIEFHDNFFGDNDEGQEN